jgi:hypothetical protein
MRVGIATDHGGFGLKGDLVARLRAAGHDIVDFGADGLNADDQASQGFQHGDARLGVLGTRRVERRHTDPKTRIRRRRQSIEVTMQGPEQGETRVRWRFVMTSTASSL